MKTKVWTSRCLAHYSSGYIILLPYWWGSKYIVPSGPAWAMVLLVLLQRLLCCLTCSRKRTEEELPGETCQRRCSSSPQGSKHLRSSRRLTPSTQDHQSSARSPLLQMLVQWPLTLTRTQPSDPSENTRGSNYNGYQLRPSQAQKDE